MLVENGFVTIIVFVENEVARGQPGGTAQS